MKSHQIQFPVTLKPALHTSWVKCSICFFYYRSLTLMRAGVIQQ